MNKKKRYILFVIPVMVSTELVRTTWVTAYMKTINGKYAWYFDWTTDIRRAIYFETREEAIRIGRLHVRVLHPHFCEIVEMNQSAIELLGVSKSEISNNPMLHDQ